MKSDRWDSEGVKQILNANPDLADLNRCPCSVSQKLMTVVKPFASIKHRAADLTHPKMSEKRFEQMVHDTARVYGWKYYHTYRSRFCEPGFPDCLMIKGQQIIVAELKVGKNKETPAQAEWLKTFAHSGDNVRAFIWRPEDWENIVLILGCGK